jgi:cytochrome P450
VKEEDVLQQFCDARYQNVYNGRQLTEEEIAGLLIAVLFAGQHTSSITSSWTGYFMINDKVRRQSFWSDIRQGDTRTPYGSYCTWASHGALPSLTWSHIWVWS